MNLGFKIVRTPYPPASKMTGTVVQKIRDDGRVGPAVGDEALLWQALMETRAALEILEREHKGLGAESRENFANWNQALTALRDGTTARLDAEKERDELRAQLARVCQGRDELLAKLTDVANARDQLEERLAEAQQKGRSKR